MTAPAPSNTKAQLLQNVVEHVDITSFDARPIIDSMPSSSGGRTKGKIGER